MATHDYVIDNSTGANVRADINNVLQAILTNNSSSSAPSTTAAYMWWADTTNGVLKIRNSSDNAWVELLQLDGTLTLENGSASAPALAFRDDLNTGIYQAGDDDIRIATAGVERLALDGNNTVFNEDGADTDFRIEGDTEANLFYVDASTDRIGINDSTPLGKLHIISSSASITSVNSDANELVLENNGNCGITIASSTSTQGAIAFADSGNNDIGKIVYDHSDNSMFFKTADLERIRIDSTGRLGIGASSFNDTAEYLLVKNDSTAANVSIVGANNAHSSLNLGDEDDFNIQKIKSDHTDNSLQLYTNNSERMRIKDDGDVEINDGNLIIGTSGHGIDFSATGGSASGSTNALFDDYEEGTWTPAYSASNATFGYHTQTGKYRKVGNVVSVTAYIRTSSVSATAHNLVKVTGLPFTEGAALRTPGSVRCNGFQGTLDNMDYPSVWSVEASQNFAELQRFVDGGFTDYTTSTMNNATFVYLQCTYMTA